MLLVAAAFTGDHRAAVGFGTGGRQRQHTAHRHRVGDVAADGLQDMPGVAVGGVTGGGGDELGAVNHRTAADRQQEIDVFRLHHLDRFHQRFVGRVRLDAGELPHVAAGQRAVHLIQHAVFLHAAATVGDQDACVRRDLAGHFGNLVFAEQDFGWGMQNEVLHG